MAVLGIDATGTPPVEPLAPEAKAKVASPGHADGDAGAGRKRPPRRRPASEGKGDADISELAGVAYDLQELQRDHPARFRTAMSEVAAAVEGEAERAPDPHARVLRDLADRFREAGRTGVLPPLVPLEASTAGEGGVSHRLHSYATQQAAAAGDTVRHPALSLAKLIRGVLCDAAK